MNKADIVAAVHPHVCGEHSSSFGHKLISLGSSPRVWGTFHPFTDIISKGRFIPTCVGNIGGTGYEAKFNPVHPHVCGEHMISSSYICYVYGSSPRVWGTCLGN